jgi:phosphoglycolate/pyridoxal phosphate phosphatase family enzyme
MYIDPMSALTFLGYIFDLDGTIYLGEKLIPGARETIEKLKSLSKKIVYLSNKPLQTREDYASKLTRLGIPTQPDEVINSSLVMARWLSREAPGATIYVIGEIPLIDEMVRAGFRISEKAGEIQYVIASFDRTFDYRKLNIALQAIKKGARFIATNPDRTCPVEGGEIPDCAAVIGAVEGTTGKKVEAIVGKPSDIMIRVAVDYLGLRPQDCVLVGDRLETDMVMGKKAGMATALVLSGVTNREILKKSVIQPDYVWESVAEIIK